MDRRTFICRAASGFLAVPFAVQAQQAARLPRIGVLYQWNMGTGIEVLRQGGVSESTDNSIGRLEALAEMPDGKMQSR